MSLYNFRTKDIGYKPFGSILRGVRQEAKLTMRDAAEKVGAAAHSFIGKVENAERRLDVVEFVNYCEGLGADPQKVLADYMKERQELLKS